MKIIITPIQPSGNYIKAKIEIKDKNRMRTLNGEIIISKTILSVWKNEITDINKILDVVGKLTAEIYYKKNIFNDGLSYGISSCDTNDRTYTEYITSLKAELEILDKGRELNEQEVLKIFNWTKTDISQLKSIFPSVGDNFASSGYSIFLFCLMDIWGSIFRKCFGKKDECNNNVDCFLEKVQQEKGVIDYAYDLAERRKLTNILRHNLVHNYGLRVLKTNIDSDWPNIDTSSLPIINLQDNNRWHVNCIRLSEDMLKVIEKWVRNFAKLGKSKNLVKK